MKKRWRVAPQVTDSLKKQFPELHDIILQLLANREITTQEQIDEFLNPDYGQDIHDPFLFVDMEKSVDRILSAIKDNQEIVVYGDYDADGVSATTLLSTVLRELGASCSIYIPFRETEGYGLNMEAVKGLKNEGKQLVVTVDCGIANRDEIDYLQKNKIDVIVTDHHQEPEELPPAYAIVNPNTKRETKYPNKYLAGCGVAYKLTQALMMRYQDKLEVDLPDGWEKWLLDLVAIGTVADLMPLLGENRTLVKYGLIVLQKTKRLGIKELVSQSGGELSKINERSIGFQIAPRLNAAGRLDHASTAYQLLITNDEKEASELSKGLNLTNQQRQQVTEKISNEALKQLSDTSDSLLVANGKGWPTGVVGLVAGRITERYYRPTFVISHFGDEIIGSGRSIPELNLMEVLKDSSDYLKKFGGHKQACGFTVKDEANLPLFIEKAKEVTESKLKGLDLVPTIEIDAEVHLRDIDWNFFEDLDKFHPFGKANPQPQFMAQEVIIDKIDSVGKNGNHLRMMVMHDDTRHKMIGFGFGEWTEKVKIGDKVDIVFEVDINEWNGNRELQLKIIDLRVSTD